MKVFQKKEMTPGLKMAGKRNMYQSVSTPHENVALNKDAFSDQLLIDRDRTKLGTDIGQNCAIDWLLINFSSSVGKNAASLSM